MPTISLVLCTHNRHRLFRNALQSLIEQTASSNDFEVVVVENETIPSREMKEIFARANKKINVRHIHEPQLGLSIARTAGGKAAKANYIGYIDDDSIVPSPYVDIALEIIQNYHPDVFGGPIFPYYSQQKPSWFKDSYGTESWGEITRWLGNQEFLSGPNMIFKREILSKVGWFDPRLSMSGRKRWYGSETLVQIKAWDQKKELRVYYDPILRVQHLVTPNKLTIRHRALNCFQMARSQIHFWVPESEYNNEMKKAPYRLIRASLKLIIKNLPGVIFRDRKKYPYWQNYVFKETFRTISVMGAQYQWIVEMISNQQ